MQLKLFRPIDEKWCHYRPIDKRGLVMRLHLSLFGSCYYLLATLYTIAYVGMEHGTILSLLAVVLWNYRHEMKNRFDGVTLWCANHHEDAGPSTYMPVQRIASLFCPAYDVVSESQVMFPCPLSLKLCL